MFVYTFGIPDSIFVLVFVLVFEIFNFISSLLQVWKAKVLSLFLYFSEKLICTENSRAFIYLFLSNLGDSHYKIRLSIHLEK